MSDRQAELAMERAIGRLLRVGVSLAAAVVLIGAAIYLFRHGGEPAGYGVFRGEAPGLRELGRILVDAASLNGRSLIQFGLLILIATPILRVAYAACAFARQRDALYACVSLLVLAILLFSLLCMH